LVVELVAFVHQITCIIIYFFWKIIGGGKRNKKKVVQRKFTKIIDYGSSIKER